MGYAIPYDVRKEVAAYWIASVKLLSAKASGEFTYLLFDITGPSRGPENAMSRCGAGDERSLVWLKLGRDWTRVDAQSFVFESCWEDASPDHRDLGQPLTFEGPELFVGGTTYRDPSTENSFENYRLRRYELHYSLKNPEAGLQVTLTAVDR